MPTPAQMTVSLPIASREASWRFYTNVLELDMVGEPVADGMSEPLQFRLDTGTTLMLVPRGGFGWVVGADRVGKPGASECLLGFAVSDKAALVALADRATGEGGRIHAAPETRPWGFCAVIADPDDHLWMVVEGG